MDSLKNGTHLKRVQLFPSTFKVHTSYRSLIDHPPKGYVILPPPASRSFRFVGFMKKYRLIRKMYHLFIHLFKSSLLFETATTSSIRPDIDLVFAMSTLYRGTAPYVLEILDNPFSIAGYNYEIFMRQKKEISKNLSSPLCKRIICANTPTLAFMRKEFSSRVAKKCMLVRTGLDFFHSRAKKKSKKSILNLLFVGSITNPQDFYSKGGLETIELFERICRKRDAQLIVRCKVPEEIAERIQGNKRITLIEQEISSEELHNLYMESDIFILPGHHFHLMAMLEAMSHGLPVITLDTYAFSEYVVDGYNGYLVKKSTHIQGYHEPSYPCNVKSEAFTEEIKKIDERVINDLCECVLRLADNEKLRRRMGANSLKRMSTHFSISKRNSRLKKIFDTAIR